MSLTASAGMVPSTYSVDVARESLGKCPPESATLARTKA